MGSPELKSVGETVVPTEYKPAECDKHGSYEQKITKIMTATFRSPCPTCYAENQERKDQEERERKAWERKRNLDFRLGSSAIPKRFVDKSFDGYEASSEGQQRALKVCREYVDYFEDHHKAGRCLMMVGRPGTGKTHLSAAIANAVMHLGDWTAVYRPLGSILHSIRDTYSSEATKTEGQIIAALVSADLLIIDEIGASKEKPSDFELSVIFAIVNGRYEDMKPTLIVSNLPPSELPFAMGERCVDRMRENGGIVLGFDWGSSRGVV
ncbi:MULTISPECIES: ATP-binding protein [Pseudomonas]|uniref:ATP-binding protein n=1 Tax=Pseudomonas TaxID=286 RepID=UPI0030011FED